MTIQAKSAKIYTKMKLIKITFKLPLQPWQISQFRGAMSDWVTTHKKTILSEEEMALFHNHNNSQNSVKNFHYRYPLIQYRSIKEQAAMFVLQEAIPVVQKVLMDTSPPFVMQKEVHSLQWTDMPQYEHALRMANEPQTYRLRNWIALNKERFEEWSEIRGLTRKVVMLQKAAVGHILSFAIGMDWQVPEHFEVELLELRAWKQVRYHKVHLNAFDVVFQVSILLPEGIGLGKATSHGFGVLQKWKYKE